MTDDLHRLAADLDKGAWKTLPAVAAVVAKGAQNIKDRMVEDARTGGPIRRGTAQRLGLRKADGRSLSTGSSYQHFHRSIGYDLKRGGLEAEIGPDKDKTQGALGNILYFGTSKNAPVLDIDAGLREEAPRFEKHIADAAAGALGL